MNSSVSEDKHDVTPSSASAQGDYVHKRHCVLSLSGGEEGADVEAGGERLRQSLECEERGGCIARWEREDT